MDFSGYRGFDAAFTAKYRWLFSQYPFASMLLEKQLRNFEVGHEEVAKANLRKVRRYNPGRVLRAMLYYYSRRETGQRHYYMHMQRSEQLEDGLEPLLASFGLNRLENLKHLHRLATAGTAYPRFMRLARQQGFEAALADRPLLALLEAQARSNYTKVLTILRKSKVSLLISDGDTLPHARMLCRAAKEIGSPYIVVSHGYIQDYCLVSIAPIYGDYHVTWTQQQASDLIGAVNAGDAGKIRFFGYPKETFAGAGIDNLVLIVWHTFLGNDRAGEIEALGAVVARFHAEGYDLRLRLHPKDRGDRQVREALEGLDIAFSENPLGVDIREAEIVVGSYSSVLVEAAMSGKKVFQLDDYRDFRFEHVDLLSAGERLREKARDAGGAAKPAGFDYSAFADFLKNVANPD